MPIPARLLTIAMALIGLALILAPAGAGQQAIPVSSKEDPGNYDIRFHGRPLLVSLEEVYGASSFRAMHEAGIAAVQAMEGARHFAPGVEVRRSSAVGGAERVRSLRGRLTEGASGHPAAQTVLTFLHDQATTYGLDSRQADELEVLGESVSRDSGLKMVRLRQRVRGLPVFQSETRAILDREGRLVATVGGLVPGIQDDLAPDFQGLLPPEEALRHALASVDLDVDVARLHLRGATSSSGAVEVVSEDPRLPRPIHSERVYFPLSAGMIVPAWSQVTYVAGDTTWYTVVDGRTGILLYRKNLRETASRRDARFSVYAESDGHPLDSPAPGSPNQLTPGSGTQFPAVSRSVISMFAVQDPVASPDGWIPDNGTTTTGNNVDAFLNRNDDLVPDKMTLDTNGRPMGNPDANGRKRDFLGAAPRNFTYTPAPLGSNPDAGDDPSTAPFQRGAVTNVFYLANWWHDRLYRLGFDEAAGNFQDNNFRRGGVDGDRVLIFVQQGADVGTFNNAGATVTPDGQSGSIDLDLFDAPGPDRDSDVDAGIVLHEFTHLLTNRIIGNGAGLNFGVSRGMGEGWSDFYALSLLYDHPGDDPNAQYAPSGDYSTYLVGIGTLPPGSYRDNYLYATRTFPYTTDNQINPLTMADADPTTFDLSGGIAPAPFGASSFGAGETHFLGEIWSEMLWEVRSRIIAAHGSVPVGNQITLQVVTDALKLTPTDPSFLDARDAVLDADCAANACAHEEAIWAGFADRGLGYGATDSGGFTNDQGIQESSSMPRLDVAGVSVSDPLGDGDGFAEPGETVNLTVSLVNPWRQAGKAVASAQATLSAVGSDATVLQGVSTYGAIPPQGETAGTPFVVSLNSGLACGAAVKFTLSVTSTLGQSNLELTLRAGRPAGVGAPLTFTHAISGGLPIPDNDSSGVTDALSISDDIDIADLDFRVDDLQHPFVGNLTLALRSPGGLLTDVIWRPGQCFTTNNITTCSQATNSGDNFIGTVIDDASSNDLIHAGPSFAPFTGDWMPAMNSPDPPFWSNPDPVGQLSRYNGRSAAGTWKLFVADHSGGNTGTLNSWSLVVTPVNYVCGP
ncbi:MAG TPA: M36 family metallopeptidase [Candidatus Polarisedimenticolia bacterium]|nr:M36 family metallopeptidase [Candidatus Polarisedimenticolia bacterium]